MFFKGIKWNFSKFLINHRGKPVGRYGPPKEPLSIEEDIKSELAKTKITTI